MSTACTLAGAEIATGSIRPKLYVLLVQLETYCWSRPWLWASNGEIARKLGVTERSVQRGLEQLEGLGVIARVMTDRERPERLGIVLLKRTNPTRPYCRTAKQLRDIAYAIRDRWADSRRVGGEVNPVILAGDPEWPKRGEGQNPEKPGRTDDLARQKCRTQHDRNVVLSTTEMSSEPLRANSPTEQQQKPLPVDGDGEGEDAKLTPEQAEAVASIRIAAELSSRPSHAPSLVATATEMIRKGHDPSRISEIAREAIRPSISNPGGWLRNAVRNRAMDEDPVAGILRIRPKTPIPPDLPIVTVTPEERERHRTARYGRGIGFKARIAGCAR